MIVIVVVNDLLAARQSTLSEVELIRALQALTGPAPSVCLPPATTQRRH